MNNFFGEGSPWFTHPLLTTERAEAEIDRVLGWCPDAVDVLDVGCGFGRHSIELAKRGLRVEAIDPSAAMVDEARRRAAEADVELTVRQGRGEDLEATARHDLALLLFTTLGQDPLTGVDPLHIVDETLRRVQRALRPGGTLVVEVPDRDRIEAMLVESEQLGPVHVERSLDTATGRVRERFAGPTDTFDLGYVTFTQDQLRTRVTAAGFDVVEHLGSALVPPPPTFQTLVAQCPTG